MDTDVVYELDDPQELLELYATHWWFDGRGREDVRRSVEHADEVVGLRDVESGDLVASARVITDYVYTGKVLDVIVHDSARGRGIGTRLMRAVVEHPSLRAVDELTVNCRAGLAPFYERCGFEVHEMINRDQEGAGEDYFVMVYK